MVVISRAHNKLIYLIEPYTHFKYRETHKKCNRSSVLLVELGCFSYRAETNEAAAFEEDKFDLIEQKKVFSEERRIFRICHI